MNYLKFLVISLLICFLTKHVQALEIENIVGGTPISITDHNYQVSIMSNGAHICGGAIISEDSIATAAHCVVDEGKEPFAGFEGGLELKVVAGTNTLKNLEPSAVSIKVNRIFLRSDYEAGKIESDVAVLKLAEKLDLKSKFIGKVELGLDDNYEDRKAVVTGFGSISLSDKRGSSALDRSNIVPSSKLYALKTTVISNTECRLKYLLYKKVYTTLPLIKINEKFICVQSVQHDKYPPSGSCSGDSGGPVVVDNKFLVGIINVGPLNCDEFYAPGAHARVSSHRKFFEKSMDDKSKCKMKFVFKSLTVCMMED